MTPDLTLIQKLVAVELGCEFERYDRQWLDDPMMWVRSRIQTLQEAAACAGSGVPIRLTSKPWDWPVCERAGVIVWTYWMESWAKTISIDMGGPFVVFDPRNPDTPPPSDWSPEGRRVIK